MPNEPPWELVGFQGALTRWVAEDDPPEEVATLVRAWVKFLVFGLPARQAHRIPEGDHAQVGDFWFAVIPGAEHGAFVVTCGYWSNARTRHITCASIRSSQPLGAEPDSRDDRA